MSHNFLENDLVRLRPFEEEDAEQVCAILNRPDVRPYMIPSTPESPEGVISYARDEAELFLMIEDQTHQKTVGHIELIMDDEVARIAEIGYMIDPDHQSNGLATAAVRLVVEYGFDELNLHKVTAEVDEDNEASKRVLEKAGFSKDAELTDAKFRDGGWIDSWIFKRLED